VGLEALGVEAQRDLQREPLRAAVRAQAVDEGQDADARTGGHGRSMQGGYAAAMPGVETAGFFSSARSLELPLGERIDADGVAGYPIDFRVKAPDPAWPPPWLPPRERQLWVTVTQFGLGCFERHLAGEGEAWLEGARSAGEHLLAEQDPDGAWMQMYRYPHSLPLPPPWPSAMAQGEAASLLVRLHAATGEERYAAAALAALQPMRVPTRAGGTQATLGGGPWPEEYPTLPGSYVLNGGLFAMWGVRDVAVGLGDATAAAEFEAYATTLSRELHRWDLGGWSRYDLFPHPIANPASSFYHQLHVTQLRAAAILRPDPELDRVRERFERALASAWRRRAAFTRKAAFRLVVPRNRVLAHRLPWTRRLVA
jgi:hypothetical protein